MAYDIIGDIHGNASKLEALLRRMGYEDKGGSWRHTSRTAVFVGDFIDRGDEQLRTLAIVRRMMESGGAKAVMGNHEFNAIAWHTPDPENPGDFLRPRFRGDKGRKNRAQHERFLAEVERDPEVHSTIIAWFKTLPLWLDLPGIRVVHACWHPQFMSWLAPQLTPETTLPPDLLAPSTREPSDESEKDNANPSTFKAVEAITKGLEIPLPAGHHFVDKDGHQRDRVRVRWWDPSATTYARAAVLPDEARAALPDSLIPAHARLSPPTDKPIFFGHYWFEDRPTVLSEHIACVDYSAGKGGPLVAYRWDGEATLTPDNFYSSE